MSDLFVKAVAMALEEHPLLNSILAGERVIINPLESAILRIDRIVEEPVVTNGRIETKSMTTLSLTLDHRVMDGVPAARFLQTLKILENPYLLQV